MTDRQTAQEQTIMGRGALLGLLACGLFPTIGLFSPGLILPQIAREFAATPNVGILTEMISAVASFAFALASPVAGMLIARFGCRRIISLSLLVFAVMGFAPAFLSSLWAILATRVILGLSLAGVMTGGLAGIGMLAPDLRIRMFGWFAGVGGATAIVMFPVIGAIGQMGWRPAFAIHLIALLAIPLLSRLPREFGIARPQAQEGPAVPGAALIGPAMVGLLLLAAFTGLSMFVGPVYAPIYLTHLGVTDTRLLAIPMTLGSIGAVFTSAAYGWFHRRLGLHGVFCASMLSMGCALLTAGTTTLLPLFTLAIILHSATLPVIASHLNAAALAFSPPEKGSQAIGLANGVMFGSQLLFPFIAAWIRSQAGLAAVFLVFGGLALLVCLLIGMRMMIGTRHPAFSEAGQ